jgi:anti-sigma-K factor RskA
LTEHAHLDELPAYALGALAGVEKARLEAHLASGCVDCARELRALADAAAALAFSAPPRDVRPEIKHLLTERIRAEAGAPERAGEPEPRAPRSVPFPTSERPERRARANPSSWLPLAAALLLAAGLGAGWLFARREADRLAAELGKTRTESSRLAGRLSAREAETAFLHDPRVQVAILKGLAGAENAKAKLLWHPDTKRAILYVEGLPPLPLTKSYELWAFVGATPKPAGVFDARPDGAAVISLASLDAAAERPTKFAVSVEPKGGVPSPTGAVVLLGESF